MEAATAPSEGAGVSADVIPLLRPPGRPRGHPKTGGRKPGSKNRRTLEVEAALRPLVPKAKRKLKALMDAEDEKVAFSACMGVLSYVFGRPVDRKEIAGAGGESLNPPPMPDREVARRIALLLTRPGSGGEGVIAELTGTAGSDGMVRVVPGRAGGEDTAVISGSPPSPSPTRHGNAGNGADKGGGGPLSNPGASESTQHTVSEFQNNFSKNAKPTVPKVGEEAVVGEHVFDGASRLVHPIKIRNLGPDRAGLPDKFVIIRDGLAVKHVGGDFDAALAWVREKFDLADVPMSIGAVGPEGPEPVRPDQMPFAVGGIEITRGYPERKN